jgi:hypothetical protein
MNENPLCLQPVWNKIPVLFHYIKFRGNVLTSLQRKSTLSSLNDAVPETQVIHQRKWT